MNLLAHSLLGFDDDALVAGQIAGDFVRGSDLSALAPGVAAGVRLHRALDARTDAHPGVAALRARFRPPLRRFAGIAIDVGLDRALARDWERAAALAHAARPAHLGRARPPAADPAEHAARVGEALGRASTSLPDALRRAAPHIVAAMPTWAGDEGVARTLRRLSRRSPRLGPLAETPAELERLEGALAALFDTLWPELVRHAGDAIAAHDTEPGPWR